jgi:Domain of unknown function (DUF4214)
MSRVSPFRPGVEQLESREVLSNTTFVAHLYQDVLGRQPDSAGYTFWVNRLDQGLSTTGQASIAFATSTEYRTNVIGGFYSDLLGRSPSTAEVNTYLSLFEAGLSQDNVRALFLGSQEFYNRVGQNPTAYVTQLYAKVLGRTASAADVAFWVNELNVSNGDRTRVARDFLGSVEYKQDELTGVYVGFLQRNPDTAGFNFWMRQQLNGMTFETLAVSFLASTEYFNRG